MGYFGTRGLFEWGCPYRVTFPTLCLLLLIFTYNIAVRQTLSFAFKARSLFWGLGLCGGAFLYAVSVPQSAVELLSPKTHQLYETAYWRL